MNFFTYLPNMRALTVKALLLILGLVTGFTAGSLMRASPPLTTTISMTETVTEEIIKTTTLTTTLTTPAFKTTTLTKTLTETRTVEIEGEAIMIELSAKPYLKKTENRWIWFNLTVSVALEGGEPIKGLKVVVPGVGEAFTDEWGVAELSGLEAGVHRLIVEWREYRLEKDFDLAFPDIDPDLIYVNMVSEGRSPRIKLVAAYYGWYGLQDLGWVHWGDPANPATKYLPLIGQISGDHISQSYSLYGFSLNEERNLKLVKRQMALAKLAGISAFAVSWWGPGSFEDRFMPTIIKAAEEVGFKVTVIFEPFYKKLPNKWDVVESSIDYLEEQYMGSEVWLRDSDGKPVVFTFDIGPHEDWVEWKRILSDKNMAWVAHTTDRSVLDYGFKYFYEYSPVGIIAAGADIKQVYLGVSDIPPYNERFIPTISPRYDDTKVRSPGYSIGEELWEDSVEAAKAVMAHRKPEFIFVTSWNEWHESTSIEPDTVEGFKFLVELSEEFSGEELSEEDFLEALSIYDCLKLCSISLT